jgi:hypothetical protein
MNSFSSLFNKKGSSSKKSVIPLDRSLIHPGRDWLIGLGMFSLVVLSGAAVSGYLFIQYSSVTVEAVPTSVILPSYNQSRIIEAITQYEQRQAVFQALITTQTPAIIPPLASATTTEATTTSERIVEEVIEAVPEVVESTNVQLGD